jgi:hypothetical protein
MIGFIAFLALVAIIFCFVRVLKNDNKEAEEKRKTNAEVIAESKRLVLLGEVMMQAKLYGDADTVQAVNNMTYDGPLPEQQPDGSYSRIYELQDYNIAGINYRENIAAYLGDFEGYLKTDPENEHDQNAIAVFHSDGHHLGFIPAVCTDDIRSLGRKFPIAVTGTIEQEHDDDEDRDYFVGTVFLYVIER